SKCAIINSDIVFGINENTSLLRDRMQDIASARLSYWSAIWINWRASERSTFVPKKTKAASKINALIMASAYDSNSINPGCVRARRSIASGECKKRDLLTSRLSAPLVRRFALLQAET